MSNPTRRMLTDIQCSTCYENAGSASASTPGPCTCNDGFYLVENGAYP